MTEPRPDRRLHADPEDASARLEALVRELRSGAIEPARVELAAFCGSELAARALGFEPVEPGEIPFFPWLHGLRSFNERLPLLAVHDLIAEVDRRFHESHDGESEMPSEAAPRTDTPTARTGESQRRLAESTSPSGRRILEAVETYARSNESEAWFRLRQTTSLFSPTVQALRSDESLLLAPLLELGIGALAENHRQLDIEPVIQGWYLSLPETLAMVDHLAPFERSMATDIAAALRGRIEPQLDDPDPWLVFKGEDLNRRSGEAFVESVIAPILPKPTREALQRLQSALAITPARATLDVELIFADGRRSPWSLEEVTAGFSAAGSPYGGDPEDQEVLALLDLVDFELLETRERS